MARRTQTFRVMPWTGGINTSSDPGVMNPQELQIADNVVFSSTGARIKREGLEYLDNDIPSPATRSSSGTTRTLVFAANELVTTSPANEKLVVGERITVSGVASYAATDVPILTRTDLGGGVYSITYTGGSSLTEASTAAGSITIARASKVIAVQDYWHYSGGVNIQKLVYATDDFQLFYLDSSGRRVQIHGQEQTTTVVCLAAAAITTGDYFLLNSANNATGYYVWYNKASGGGDPAIAGRTAIPVAIGGGDTDAQVASATQAAIDALADFTASVNTATVTITNVSSGLTDRTVDGNTGFTFNTTAYGATAPGSAVSTIKMGVMNERLLLAFSGAGNYPIRWNPDENSGKYRLWFNNVNGAPVGPDCSFFFQHLGRLWCDDKTQKDYINYSETFDETLWYGIGDSGALPIGLGDGDPEGLTGGYAYKDFAILGKKAKRYRVAGYSPEEFQVQMISEGLGNEGPLAIPVDEVDVVFVSKRGIHSQQVTDQYGDTDSTYLSSDIKPTFNEWEAAKLKFMQGAYIPELNSIAVSVAEDGQTNQNAVWLYNIEAEVPGRERRGAWYRWPDISCTALSRRFINAKYKLVFGTENGRIIQAQKESTYTDFGTTGIPFKIRTGHIYPGSDPHSVKAFKKISMVYRPRGNFTFTVKAYVDNGAPQSFSFNQISGTDLLGIDFILGGSTLGSSNILAPYTYTMEGLGRGVTLEITQNSADEQVEIWGFIIEFEPADLRQSAEEEASA